MKIDDEVPTTMPNSITQANPDSVERGITEFGITAMKGPTSDGRNSDCEPATLNNEPDLGDLEKDGIFKLEGQYALVGVGNKTSGKGRKYAYIISLVAIPTQMKKDLPGFAKYERPKYWEERRAEYAKDAQKFRDDIGATQDSGKRVPSPFAAAEDLPDEAFRSEETDDDDLPF